LGCELTIGVMAHTNPTPKMGHPISSIHISLSFVSKIINKLYTIISASCSSQSSTQHAMQQPISGSVSTTRHAAFKHWRDTSLPFAALSVCLTTLLFTRPKYAHLPHSVYKFIHQIKNPQKPYQRPNKNKRTIWGIISVTSVALTNFYTTCDEGFVCSTLVPTTRILYSSIRLARWVKYELASISLTFSFLLCVKGLTRVLERIWHLGLYVVNLTLN